MLTAQQIENLVDKVSDVLPEGLGALPENMQKNLQMTLSAIFSKMDLVTREEFDVQKAVLAKTRLKCEALEKTLAELEVTLNESLNNKDAL